MYLEIMICFTYVLPQAKKKRCKLFTYNVLFNLKSGTTSFCRCFRFFRYLLEKKL